MTQKRSRPNAPVSEIAVAMPPPERSNHGIVERLERAISDSSGRPARPYRSVDTLAVMERRGSITPGMRYAGEGFRDYFAVAQLDPLRAFDISRPRIGTRSGFRAVEEPGSRIENARWVVWRATLAVGGLGSAGGSCLWHVVGWQQSLKQWALEQGWNGRRVSQEAASGMLIASLGTLEAHFAQPKTC